jgi:uroporphyrinogen decarboxylase
MVRRSNMTEKERFEALYRREKPDRVPINLQAQGFTALQAGGCIADAYNNPKVSLEGQRQCSRDFGWACLPWIAYATFGGWEFGGENMWASSEFAQAPMMSRFAVDTPEEAMKLKVPDVRKAGNIPILTEFYRMASQDRFDNEPFLSIFLMGPFTVATNICGAEKFARWLIKKPEVAHHLLRLATEFSIKLAEYYRDNLDTEGLVAFQAEPSTANQIISPQMFEKFALPYIKDFHEKLLDIGYERIYCHICGEQNLNLPFWAQIPMGNPGICSFGHEVDLETAAKYFPDDIIYGNLEPAILESGTPEKIYEMSRRIIEKGKKLPGGFIFSAGCEIPPRASRDNIMAMTRAVNDFGWYV